MRDELKTIFANNLSYYMQMKDVNRYELSTATGIPYTTISSWLVMDSYPREERLKKVADYLNITPYDLITSRKNRPMNVSEIVRNRVNDLLSTIDSADVYEMFGCYDPYEEELSGRRPITFSFIEHISDMLGVSPDYIVGLTVDYDIDENNSSNNKNKRDILLGAKARHMKLVYEICRSKELHDLDEPLQQELLALRIDAVTDFLNNNKDFLKRYVPETINDGKA